MKLSFSLSSKSQPKKPAPATSASAAVKPEKDYIAAFESARPTNNGSAPKEFLTEFDPSKPPRDPTAPRLAVIPPKPNEWRPFKKMKNLELPLTESSGADSQPLQFELDPESKDIESGSDSMSYGLNLRPHNVRNAAPDVDPGLLKFKEDMGRLPEDPGFEEYEDVPVEGFGAALLAGYGWKEGKGIGRRAKEDVKVVEYKKWSGKEGLGFVGETPGKSTGGRDGNKDKAGENARVGNDNGRNEEKGRLYVGKEVRVVEGREIGMKGRVLELKNSGETVILRLSEGGEEVVVRLCDVADLGSLEEKSCLRKLKELNIKEKDGTSNSRERRDKTREKYVSSSRNDRESKNEEVKDRRKKEGKHREREDVKMGFKKESKQGGEQLSESNKVPWLRNHIRVRIISEKLKGGRLYLKKGEVVDVFGPSCDILMDESREVVQGVNQDYLETALPKRGGPVLVLFGRHRGVYGSLVEKDSKRETGVVHNADNHELFKVRLEQIAEFIGDPSYIGY